MVFLSHTRNKRRRGGQAMIESVFVIIVLCLAFLAAFQYARLFEYKTVLTHAAARSARARAVGFNRWMIEKSARVAAIPASGRRLNPPPSGLDPALAAALSQARPGDVWDAVMNTIARSPGSQLEVARIPDYMNSINEPTGAELLDYELWDTLSLDLHEPANVTGEIPGYLTVHVRQVHPLLIALEPLADGELRDAAGDTFAVGGFFTIESHYPLYMEDANW